MLPVSGVRLSPGQTGNGVGEHEGPGDSVEQSIGLGEAGAELVVTNGAAEVAVRVGGSDGVTADEVSGKDSSSTRRTASARSIRS